MSVHAIRKAMTTTQVKHTEKPQAKSHKNQTHESKWVRLENQIATPVMRHEQPESMSHMFSNPPSNTYMGWEEVNGSVLG
jgi:hypothetical protein